MEKGKIAELLQPLLVPERVQRLDEVLAARTSALTLVLDGVYHEHNVAAVMRSADAFGLKTIHLIKQKNISARGISMGTERWMNVQVHESAEAVLEYLKAENYELVITAPKEDLREVGAACSVPVFDLPFERRLALVFGNEKRGVSELLCQAAKWKAYIPMFGFVESLNVSVACAITLFCSTLSGAREERRVQGLAEDERLELRDRWFKNSVENAEVVLAEMIRRQSGNPGD